MRRTFHLMLFLLFAQSWTMAQGHSVGLSWGAPKDATPGSTYTIYRVPGLCSGTPVFAKLATAVSTTGYSDATVTPGNYCYTVTQVQGGAESPQATPVAAAVLPSAVVLNPPVIAQWQVTVPLHPGGLLLGLIQPITASTVEGAA